MSGTTLLNLETILGSLGRNSTSPVTLGSFTFSGTEVPSLLPVAGEQGLVVRRLAGGARIMQTMGNDPAPFTLAGLFTGPNAQTRAQAVEALKNAGKQISFGAAGLSVRVVIKSFGYSYAQQGVVLPYQLVLEVQTSAPAQASTSPTALAGLVAPDVASSIQSVADGVSEASAYAGSIANQAQAIVGQVAPVAGLVGAGGLLAGIEDQLTAVSGLATAGTNFAAAPAAAASAISGLQSAGTDLMTTINQAGANIQGIQAAAPAGSLFSDAASMQTQIANAGALSAAVQAGAYLNRAAANTSLAAGITPSAPVVHA